MSKVRSNPNPARGDLDHGLGPDRRARTGRRPARPDRVGGSVQPKSGKPGDCRTDHDDRSRLDPPDPRRSTRGRTEKAELYYDRSGSYDIETPSQPPDRDRLVCDDGGRRGSSAFPPQAVIGRGFLNSKSEGV